MAATDQHSTEHSPGHSTELQHHDGAAHGGHGSDPEAEPSAAWGWHGEFPKMTAIAGWITAISMFLMLMGNHDSWVEDAYLVGIGALLVVMLIGGSISKWSRRR